MERGSSKAPLEVERLVDGARLFVIGGTGFLGKIFWAMLLHRYPNLGRIYLLVRGSKGKSSEERFWTSVVTSHVLDPLREQHGADFEAFIRDRVIPVDGDLEKPACGIAPELLGELRGTIDAVINVAGIVDFNPPLDDALHANAFGAQNLVALSRALGEVPILHTSTCYVAGRRKGPILETDPTLSPFPRCDELDRSLWDPDREIADCLDIVAQANHRCDDAFRQSEFADRARQNLLKRGEPTHGDAFDAELASVKRRFVVDRLVESGLERATHWGWPNIYTYTKSIGEQVIARSGIPFTIVRPACSESCSEFPFPGWNEGINTSAPIIFLAMKGQVQVPGRKVILDFIPADMVCAGMILSLAELLEGTQEPVYQYGTSDSNPATAARLNELIGLYKRKYYQRTGKGNPWLNLLQAHYEPLTVSPDRFNAVGPPAIAKAGKTLASLMRKAPPLRSAARALEGIASREEKIGDIMNLFAPFTSQENGPFSCANTRAAYRRATDADRAKLPWAPEKIDWMVWMQEIHMPGIEKWVIPEMDAKLARELRPLRAHPTLATLVDEMAERHDLALAFQRLEDVGLTRITYADVRVGAISVAARLAARGLHRGDRVILSAQNHPDWAIAYFGIVRAGGTVVPVDPALAADAFGNVIKDSGARLAIWDTFVDERSGAAIRTAAPALEIHALDAITTADSALAAPDVTVEPDDVASLIYTSGTTGQPKGVMLTHANFTSLVAALAPVFPLGSGDRVLSVLPLHHTFEFTCGLLLPFSRGARILYLDELNGDRLAAGLQRGRITAMVGVPALWQLLERRILAQVKARGPVAEMFFKAGGELNRLLGRQLGLDVGKLLFGEVHDALGGHVRWLISGGAALPAETQRLFAGVGLHLTEGYGLTEAAPVLTVGKSGPRALPGRVGKAVPGVEVRIDEPDERGVGEVVARGKSVMAGYTDPDATARTIDAQGWLHTGDLGKMDRSGQLQIVGRLKDVIVTSTGENVYPDDVERLLSTVAHVEELAIVGAHGVGGAERVACLAVPAADETLDRAARIDRAMRSLRAAIANLPYGMQPGIVHLYDAPLPRTATRKVKRNEVKAILERMALATATPDDASAETSQARLAIAAVAGRPITDVIGSANLQGDLGFDSLMLVELQSALESRGGAIDPASLQSCRTVADVEALASTTLARQPSRTRGIEGRDRDRARRRQGTADEPAPIVLPPIVQQSAKRLLGKFQHAFYDRVMTPEVTGRSFIPHNRNTIVISNHTSHLDMGFVKYALGSYGQDLVSLAAQDYFFEGGRLRRAYFENLTNLAAIDRKSGLRHSLRQAGEVLEHGKTMLLFPEGTRSPDGGLQEFKSLVGYLALTHGVDILPIYLGGTHEAMPKGGKLPTSRRILARIGPPMCVADMRRLTEGMGLADAAREVARLAQRAVTSLRDGTVLDLSTLKAHEAAAPERQHPLVRLFAELEGKFRPEKVSKAVSFYFTLGGDAMAKWTVLIDPASCVIKAGKPDSGTADCVLKTSPEIFTRIVREAYTPGIAEFMSGAVKSNDVELLQTFQRAFQLG